MAKWRYVPEEWEDSVRVEDVPSIHPLHERLTSTVDVSRFYEFPRSKEGTHKKLMSLYKAWAVQTSGSEVWIEGQGWRSGLCNAVTLFGDCHGSNQLNYAVRLEAGRILAGRVAAVAIKLLPPATVKNATTWEDVTFLTNNALDTFLKEKVSKLGSKKERDMLWEYVSNRTVPVLNRYDRFMDKTGYTPVMEFVHEEAPLLVLEKADVAQVLAAAVEQYQNKIFSKSRWEGQWTIEEMVAVAGSYEIYSMYGVDLSSKPRYVRHSKCDETQLGMLLTGKSVAAHTSTVSQEEIRYFNSSLGLTEQFLMMEGSEAEEAEAVLRTASHDNWCTSKGTARQYAAAPFLIWFKNSVPHIAVRFNDEGEVQEIQTPQNNGIITSEVKSILASEIIPFVNQKYAQGICAYLDSAKEAKEWVTAPSPVGEVFAAFNSKFNPGFHITEDKVVWELHYQAAIEDNKYLQASLLSDWKALFRN